MAQSGSKYATMLEAMEKKLQTLSLGVDDSVRQKVIEAELKRIDEETAQVIDEIRSQPIDKELIKTQAKSDLESIKKENARRAVTMVSEARNEMREAEAELERIKREYEVSTERAKEIEEASNLKAQQEYERVISSVGNIEQTIKLRIQKAEAEGRKRKSTLMIEQDNLDAKNSVIKEKIACIDKLYNDLKEISLKLGDAGSK